MMILPVGIEHALDVPVQRAHNADARQHVGMFDIFTGR
jgi:hypothetical protein